MAFAAQTLTNIAVGLGLGRHEYYLLLSPQLQDQMYQAMKCQTTAEFIVIFSFMFIRISVCLFLMRIFGQTRVGRFGFYSILAFITASNMITIFLFLFQCEPVKKIWNPLIPGTCRGFKIYLANGYHNGSKSCPLFLHAV